MDLSKFKDLKDIEALLELMARHELAELEFESDGQKIRFRKAEPWRAAEAVGYPPPAYAAPAFPGQPMAPSLPAAQPAAAASEAAGETADEHEVESPLVGSFYRSPSPEAEPFVKEGDRVESDTILCIIEAMKVMNEINAGVSGVIKEILVKNTEAVEFGQPLFRIHTE